MAASIKLLFLLLISLSFTYITSEPEPEPEPQRFSLENILDQLKSHISVLGFLSFSICVCVCGIISATWALMCSGISIDWSVWLLTKCVGLSSLRMCCFIICRYSPPCETCVYAS
jgi:hypothetical protein